MRAMTPSYVCHDSFTFVCVPWLIYICMCAVTHLHTYVFTLVSWLFILIHMCDMTPSYVWQDSFICVTWLMHTCAMSHSYACHDSLICGPWLIYIRMCAMTHLHSYVFTHVSWLFHMHVCQDSMLWNMNENHTDTHPLIYTHTHPLIHTHAHPLIHIHNHPLVHTHTHSLSTPSPTPLNPSHSLTRSLTHAIALPGTHTHTHITSGLRKLWHWCGCNQCYMCVMTPSYAPWLIYSCAMTRSYAPWLIYMCAMTRSYAPWLTHMLIAKLAYIEALLFVCHLTIVQRMHEMEVCISDFATMWGAMTVFGLWNWLGPTLGRSYLAPDEMMSEAKNRHAPLYGRKIWNTDLHTVNSWTIVNFHTNNSFTIRKLFRVMCAMTPLYMCYDLFTCVPWQITSELRKPWRWCGREKCCFRCFYELVPLHTGIHTYEWVVHSLTHSLTHPHTLSRVPLGFIHISLFRNISFMCMSWQSCVCTQYEYESHDVFTGVTWLIDMCDVTHSCVCHDSFICVS